MQLRYVEAMRQAEICRELGLGHTSFYSHLRAALDAAVSILWSRLPADAPAVPPLLQARAEAAHAAAAAPRVSLDTAQVWQEALNFVAPLAARRGVSLPNGQAAPLPAVSADRGTLRQVFINILAEVFSDTAPGPLNIRVEHSAGRVTWRIPAPGSLSPQHSTTLAVCQGILEVYGGGLEYETQSAGLAASLPAGRSPTVLVVDDNADAAELIQRYLQGGYQIRAACGEPEAAAFLAGCIPDLIILDVILPQQDGWNILQRLKTLPETARVPVIICSVLTHPELALLMGADGVLQKPVDPAALLPMVERLLRRSDSAAEPAPPAG